MQIHSRAKVDFYKTYLERYVSILCQSQYIKHIDHLRKLDASIKFLSCEPVIEDLEDLNLQGIDWVIVGGESGPQAHPMQLDWVVNIKQQVELQGAAFFF